jgi:GNAT superfamily N-acetyltransferase
MVEERIPPKKIRVTGLQEAQLKDLVRIEEACARMFWEIGLTEQQLAPRAEFQIARLTRDHAVLVAEADDAPVGYLAWADQAPGVAWLPILMVAPEFQRFGVGTRLLRDLGEAAGNHGIETVVAPVWTRAAWSLAFLAVRGFQQVGVAPATEKLALWQEERGAGLIEPGQQLWWAKTDGLGTVPGLPRPR